MELRCNVKIDLNGKEIFMVDKKILASYSARFHRLCSTSKGNLNNQKVIFNKFPGGAKGFEIMAKFCYNNGKIDITPSNIVQLNSIAKFMEMSSHISGNHNLLQQTEKSLEEIGLWNWSALLQALKQCQEINSAIDMEFLALKIIDSIAIKIGSSNLWFNDVMFFNINLVEKLVKKMVLLKLDHFMISKFIFHYQKFKFLDTNLSEKEEIIEGVINLISLLEKPSISYKFLFEIFRVCYTLKISKLGQKRLEFLIGLRLDEVTLDYLLIKSPNGKYYKYDVNVILRFVKSLFVEGNFGFSISQLNKVCWLIDSYLLEIAADIYLKPSKFVKLVKGVPDFARISHNQLYFAMDLYLEVHAELCKEEKMKVYSLLNYDKLSAQVLKHLEGNSNFPSKPEVQVPITRQFNEENLGKKDEGKRIIVYAKKLDNSTNSDKLIAQYQELQQKVMELDRICRTKQNQMGKDSMKSKVSSHGSNARSLPKLCSC